MSTARHSPRRHAPLASRFALFLSAWIVLAGFGWGSLIVGMIAAAGAAWLSRALAREGEPPLRLWRLVPLVPGFLWRSWTGGVDVARRAAHPAMPLKTGWIAHPLTLREGAPRVLLGCELSLLPGTLMAGERGGRLLVHCLDTDQPVRRRIAEEEARFAPVAGDD